MTQLEKENRELRQRAGRKTLAPLVSTLLAKSGVGEGVQIELGTLEKALGAVDDRTAYRGEGRTGASGNDRVESFRWPRNGPGKRVGCVADDTSALWIGGESLNNRGTTGATG